MKQFILRSVYFSLIAITPLVAGYFYFDPFKILYHYKDYSYSYVIPNRDYISTTMFLNNYKKNGYNSFVLGSSRTLGFRPGTWHQYLPATDRPFMFDASGESVYGIYTKLKYLDSINVEIKNALIILCRDVSFRYMGNHRGHLDIKHPETSRESNLAFHLLFFKDYFNPKFLLSYYSYKILGAYKPFMKGYIEKRKLTFDTLTNELKILDQEIQITQHPAEYYKEREKIFYERTGEKIDTTQRITPKHLFMLKEIRRILEKNHTSYKVVLSPLYDQTKFNPHDFSLLKNEFGNKLYDFTGKNSFTDNKMNYYETSHFRPRLGDSILSIIYNKADAGNRAENFTAAKR